MNIAFDMTHASSPSHMRGIGRYADNLIQYLQRHGNRSQIFQYHPPYELGPEQVCADVKLFIETHRIDAFVLTSPFEFRFPEALRHQGLGRCKLVVLLHDFIPLIFESIYLGNEASKLAYLQQLELIKQADLIWANSETTKQDGIRIAQLDPAKIHVVYAGLDETFRVMSEAEFAPVTERYQLSKPYVLTVGNLEFRKNVHRLFHAFAEANKVWAGSRQLVVASHLSEEEKAVMRSWADQLGFGHNLVLTGYVALEDLVRLYNGAEFSIYPSLYEGFGFPAMEAMACGTPVVTSDRSSTKELCDGAAYLVDPENIQSLAAGMLRIAEGGPAVEALRRAGLELVKRFRWSHTADAMLSTLRTLEYRLTLPPNRYCNRKKKRAAGRGVLLSYNLGMLPASAVITQATMSLPSRTNRPVRIKRLKKGWSVKSAARKLPSISKHPVFRKLVRTKPKRLRRPVVLDWNCLALAREWKANPLHNHGLLVTGPLRRKPHLHLSYHLPI